MAESKKSAEKAPEITEPELVESAESAELNQLTGSGGLKVKVRANAGCLGLASGEVGTFDISTPELDPNIANGNLSLVTD